MESTNEFTDWMKDTLEEAKAALAKSKDDTVGQKTVRMLITLEKIEL
jgi:hypothetical protein